MHPELSGSMEEYGRIAKEVIATKKELHSGSMSEEEARSVIGDLNIQLNRYVKEKVANFDTSKEAQAQIYQYQMAKQKIMDQLHEDFRSLDNDTDLTERFDGKTPISMDENGNLAAQIDGQNQPLGEEDLYTDVEWGIDYDLSSDQIPKEVKKRYFVESAKSKLRELLDKQIYEFETGMSVQDDQKRGAYEAVMSEREGELTAGHVIEKMIRNFFKKMEFTGSIDLEIIDTNIYQDIEQKIDFIIHRKNHLRGIRAETNADIELHGIQFTTNTDPEVLSRKIEQIERVKKSLGKGEVIEDLVLVQMPHEISRELYGLYKKWRDDMSKIPGGPDKLFSAELKETLLRNILKTVLSNEEIDLQWDKMKTRF